MESREQEVAELGWDLEWSWGGEWVGDDVRLGVGCGRGWELGMSWI